LVFADENEELFSDHTTTQQPIARVRPKIIKCVSGNHLKKK